MRGRRFLASGILLLFVGATTTGCFDTSQSDLVRSDMPTNGMNIAVTYNNNAAPDGAVSQNEAVTTGMNETSPIPELKTIFGRAGSATTQVVQATRSDGSVANVLGMTKWTQNFGLTNYLKVQPATYDFHDAKGGRVCGAKVRMTYLPNGFQMLAGDRHSWDAIWYYDVPCTPGSELDVDHAHFRALVITEIWQFRLSGKPLAFNRGRSVTIVDGVPATLKGGWWKVNALPGSDKNSILGANALVQGMVHDLASSPQPWLEFKPDGKYTGSTVVYAAGDADVFFSLRRLFLNRQSDYLVNFRNKNGTWRRVLIHPVYNYEWNDLSQQFHALNGQFNPLDVNDQLDDKGFPKDPNDSVIKEIEKAGCQNCPNTTLEQIQILDANTHRPLYAMTIRGYLGASSSLVMFGSIPRVSLPAALNSADRQRQSAGINHCPVRYDSDGKKLDSSQQISDSQCAYYLREGALWDLITKNPDSFGFDLVSQYRVTNNSTFASQCSGSGDSTSCTLVPLETKLNASYNFNRPDKAHTWPMKPWTVMQLLGEVGVRTLGMTYVSDPYAGNGMLFAMEQPMMASFYANGMESHEDIFALDARALQLPDTLAQASKYLFGS